MGYTHYWTPTRPLTSTSFARIKAAAEEIVAIAQSELKIALADGHGNTGTKPDFGQVHDSAFSLNGLGDEAHETFYIDGDVRGFTFCKTACKPYDVVVTAILCLCDFYTEGTFGVESDGCRPDWKDGLKLARRIESDCQIPKGVSR
jgi:hypothetical protein